MNVPKILANMEAVLTWSMTIFVNVVPDIREKIVMKKLMNVSLILANMEAVLTWSMTILVNAVPDTREKIVMKFSILVTSQIEAVVSKFVTKLEPKPFAHARINMSSTRIRNPAWEKRGATPNIATVFATWEGKWVVRKIYAGRIAVGKIGLM